MTTWSARTVAPPAVVTTTPPATRSRPATRVRSWMRTPRSRATPREAAAQLDRVEQDVAPRRPVEAGQEERGVDLGLDRRPVHELELLAVAGRLVGPRAELVDLVGLVGDGQRARLLEVAVDRLVAGERHQAAQVVEALPLEDLELIGEVPDPVGQAVRQRRLAEPAVPPAGAERDGLRLEDGHPQAGCRVGQRQRRPQAREPGADHDDVGGRVAEQRRIGGRDLAAQPVADRAGSVVLGSPHGGHGATTPARAFPARIGNQGRAIRRAGHGCGR